MMRRFAASVATSALLLGGCGMRLTQYRDYHGDGTFTPQAAAWICRDGYSVDLGDVDLTVAGELTRRLDGLPSMEAAVGLALARKREHAANRPVPIRLLLVTGLIGIALWAAVVLAFAYYSPPWRLKGPPVGPLPISRYWPTILAAFSLTHGCAAESARTTLPAPTYLRQVSAISPANASSSAGVPSACRMRAMRTASSRASMRPEFMLCTPTGAAWCAASPA